MFRFVRLIQAPRGVYYKSRLIEPCICEGQEFGVHLLLPLVRTGLMCGRMTTWIRTQLRVKLGNKIYSFKQSNRSINHFNWLLITKLYFNNNVKEEKEGFGVWLVSNDYYYYL